MVTRKKSHSKFIAEKDANQMTLSMHAFAVGHENFHPGIYPVYLKRAQHKGVMVILYMTP